MKKEEKKNEIQNLLLTVRVVGILSLFEIIFILFYYVSTLFDTRSIKIIEKLNIQGYDTVYMMCLPYILGVFILYVGGIFVNYFLIKNDNKYTKKILISEIVLLVILMTFAFLTISGIIHW